MEQKLKRIHDRQEAARKLAHNVEILLQQRSVQSASKGASHNTPQMTPSELLATARNVVRDFRTLSSQMRKDFAVDDKNNNLSQKSPSCTKNQEKKLSFVESSINDNNRGVAFTVGFDDDTEPLSPVPKVLQVPNKTHKSRLTAQELEEKQRKAEERRNVSELAELIFLKTGFLERFVGGYRFQPFCAEEEEENLNLCSCFLWVTVNKLSNHSCLGLMCNVVHNDIQKMWGKYNQFKVPKTKMNSKMKFSIFLICEYVKH